MEFNEFGELEGIELLQQLPIFSKLSFDETTRLGAIAGHETVPEGTVIIEHGELGSALYVVIEGRVGITRDIDADGKREELGELSEGAIVGEMSLVDDLLTSARVTALTECRLLKLPRSEFQSLLDSDPMLAVKVYRSFCRTLSERLRHANDMLSAVQAFSIGVR